MKTIKEEDLQMLLPSSQSKTLLSRYRVNLAHDVDSKPLFDDRLCAAMYPYLLNPGKFEEVRSYLNNLKDGTGKPFSRHYYFYSKMLETLDRFLEPDIPDGRWMGSFKKAQKIVRDRYSQSNLNVKIYHTSDEIYDTIKGLDTSSGFTAIESGLTHKCDLPLINLYSECGDKVKTALREGSFNRPFIWFHRSQATGEFDDFGEFTNTFKDKSRPVWCEDVYVYIPGTQFSIPLNTFLRIYPHSAIGKSWDDIGRYIMNWDATHFSWISLDYSKYDSSIPSWLIYEAFEVARCAFGGENFRGCVWDQTLSVLCEDFIHKNIITADGVIHVDHGNPSGSAFTAIINGICNELMTETWMAEFNINDSDYMIMGDDNLIFLNCDIDIATVSEFLINVFGVKVNVNKSKQGRCQHDTPEFLSTFWKSNGRYRHPNVLTSRMLYPERFRNYDKYPELNPNLIIWSYIINYPLGMEQLIDVNRFLEENGFRDEKIIARSRDVLKHLPYTIKSSWGIVA